METDYLYSLVKVVELGSIAAAARHLNLTPASLAKRLRTLEDEMGTPLVARSGRTVQPTVAGLRVLERAANIVKQVADMKSIASANELPSGPLRLGTTPTALTQILPKSLNSWVRRYPDIEIYIEPDTTESLYAKVHTGHLDAAVMVLPSFEIPKSLMWVDLRIQQIMLLACSKVRVSDVWETIQREPLIRYSRNVVGGRLADQYLKRYGLTPHTRFELDGIEAIATLVAANLGIALLPDWQDGSEPLDGLKRYTLPGEIPTRAVGMLVDPASARSPLSRALLEILLAGERQVQQP